MTRRILAGYLGLTTLVLLLLTLPLGITFAARERDRLRTAIERDARVLAAESDDAFEEGDPASLPGLVERYVRQTGGRVVMVDERGRSVIDSASPGVAGRDFSSRPEIAAALGGQFRTGERASETLGTSIVYVAVPVRHDQDVLGVVRVSYPATAVDERVREVWFQLLALDGAVLVVGAGVGWLVARNLARPIGSLEDTAIALARGDLDARVPTGGAPPDLDRVATTFNTMAERLGGLLVSQQAFLADASHQLRTPLTALRLRLESASSIDGPANADLAAAADEVDRLPDLVDALLSMARLDAHPGRPELTDVSAVVVERVATWTMLADEQGRSLAVHDDTGGVRADVVAGGLEQMLDNLIDNALRHCRTGVTVTVSTTGDDDGLVGIAVADDGPGVPDDQLERVFDRFWRAPGATPGGTGLGLAVVRRLAETSGGTATARRGDDGGLVVEVHLPRRDRAGAALSRGGAAVDRGRGA